MLQVQAPTYDQLTLSTPLLAKVIGIRLPFLPLWLLHLHGR